jgi:hypothetical protein
MPTRKLYPKKNTFFLLHLISFMHPILVHTHLPVLQHSYIYTTMTSTCKNFYKHSYNTDPAD